MTSSLLLKAQAIIAKSSFLRFLISGGLNTLATYIVYLALLNTLGYKVAYTIAYVFGIIIAFVFNRIFVFKTHRGWRSAIFFPFVYLAQYLVSLLVIWIWVGRLALPDEVGPLIAIAITVPMTFFLSKLAFQTKLPV